MFFAELGDGRAALLQMTANYNATLSPRAQELLQANTQAGIPPQNPLDLGFQPYVLDFSSMSAKQKLHQVLLRNVLPESLNILGIGRSCPIRGDQVLPISTRGPHPNMQEAAEALEVISSSITLAASNLDM
eukprot:1149362-Pelagomonas_calceolata.AAC.5